MHRYLARYRLLLLTIGSISVIVMSCRIAWISHPIVRVEHYEAQWNQHALTDYRYALQIASFATINALEPVIVEVRGGHAVSVGRKRDGAPVIHPIFSDDDTIPEVFQQTRRMIGRAPYQLDVTYDRHVGYPAEIAVDYGRTAVDDTFTITIDAFTILTP